LVPCSTLRYAYHTLVLGADIIGSCTDLDLQEGLKPRLWIKTGPKAKGRRPQALAVLYQRLTPLHQGPGGDSHARVPRGEDESRQMTG
jgi:hypothetical protein